MDICEPLMNFAKTTDEKTAQTLHDIANRIRENHKHEKRQAIESAKRETRRLICAEMRRAANLVERYAQVAIVPRKVRIVAREKERAICSVCGHAIDSDYRYCPGCGGGVRERRPRVEASMPAYGRKGDNA